MIEKSEHDQGLGGDKEPTTGVAFLKPDYKGFFSVGIMNQNMDVKTDAKGKILSQSPIALESDQETLNLIAIWVEKRDGERLKEEWIPLAGTNAFHMIFEIGPQEDRQKGEQVHFTKDGVHYTLSMLMPKKDYDAEVGHFQEMVSSFKVQSGAKPKAAP